MTLAVDWTLQINHSSLCQLDFDAHEMGDRLFLLWPLVLTHRITETSPLWTLKPDDLIFDKFEVSGNIGDVQLLVTWPLLRQCARILVGPCLH